MEIAPILVQGAVALFASVSGWPVVLLVLRASRGHGEKPAEEPDQAPSTLRGGLWIGLVERFAIAGAVLVGQVSLIAVAIAVKGLGRFKELTTPESSEKFVLGTLVSLTWAVLVASVALALLF